MMQNKNPGDPVEEEGREELEYQLREFRKEIEEAARRDDERKEENANANIIEPPPRL